MTAMYDWLYRRLCKRRDHTDDTDELIYEVERTRRELLRLTERLAGHVAELKAFAHAHVDRHQEGPHYG